MGDRSGQHSGLAPVGFEIVARRLHRDGLGALVSGDVVASAVSSRPTLGEAVDELQRAVSAVCGPAGDAREIDVDDLVANIARSLASAANDDERAEAVEMLLSGWYAAWPDEALTNPDAPLAAELVRLLGSVSPRAQDNLADRLAAALRWLMRVNGGEGVTVPTWDSWEALLAEHASRPG